MAKKTTPKKKEGKISITDSASASAYAKSMGAGVEKGREYFVTEDGQIFQDINNALNHSTPKKLKYYVCNG